MRLVAENLGADRGAESVFANLSFSLSEGEILIVTGANGAGKSTLLRAVAGLLPIVAGRLEFFGGKGEDASLAANCHYLGHLNAMKPALTVAENLDFWQRFLGADGVDANAALENVGLASIGHLPFGFLSAGQRRRVAIARLLVAHRAVWLLDEPTAGLDSGSQVLFTKLLEAHLQAGGMAIAATHLPLNVTVAQELALRVGN